MTKTTHELGFPIAVSLFLFVFAGAALYVVWKFMTRQIESKDAIINDSLKGNTEATKANTQMLQGIHETLKSQLHQSK